MLTNYLKIAWRNLRKHALFSAINVFGLALGVASTLLIGLWVIDELSFDRFLPNRNRLYRLESITQTPDGAQIPLAAVGWPVGRILQKDFPEVEKLTYIKGWNPQLKHRGSYFREHGLQADESFFGVLGYELAQGDPKTALTEPFTVVISPEAEVRYFGAGNGMGKVLMVNDTLPHRVTGILKHVPHNGHLQFSMVRSMASLYTLFPQDMQYEFASGWFDMSVYNYLLLRPGVDAGAFAAKIAPLVTQRGQVMVKQTGMNSTLHLRSINDVYLRSKMPTENGPVGDTNTLYLFIVIGVSILLIACLNTINLSTARATERAKEVGVRKVLGGQKGQLVGQFLTEEAFLCIMATSLGLLGVAAALPYFRTFTGKAIATAELFTSINGLILVAFLSVLVLLTGFYPAWVLTAYQPIAVLKGRFVQSVRGSAASGQFLRKGLVVTQFAVSVGLIICTVAAWQQVRFMRQQPLGFDQQKVLVVNLNDVPGRPRHQQAQTLKNQLLKHSQITQATTAVALPGQPGWDGQFAYGEGNAPGKGILVEHIAVDPDYTKTLRLRVLAGRDFVANGKADEQQSFLINESAVKAFGWGSSPAALGKKLSVSGVNGQVIGVVRNYHQHSLQETIRPVVLNVMPVANMVAFRYEGQNPAVAIEHLKTAWQSVFAGYPLTYTFLDEAFGQQYIAEQKLIQTFTLAACLAILISCLGLFGLSTYTAQQRTKEIGVRKVLGASVGSIVTLLSRDFLKLVLIAIVIASPVAWYAMNRWLQDFAYKIDIEWWVFALAGLLAIAIALLTVSFQSVKAALMNPVKSLRSE